MQSNTDNKRVNNFGLSNSMNSLFISNSLVLKEKHDVVKQKEQTQGEIIRPGFIFLRQTPLYINNKTIKETNFPQLIMKSEPQNFDIDNMSLQSSDKESDLSWQNFSQKKRKKRKDKTKSKSQSKKHKYYAIKTCGNYNIIAEF